MQIQPLKELLKDLELEIIRLGYTEGSMRFYRNRWTMLLKFAEEENEIYYSEKLGIDFIEKYFNILKKDFEGKLTQAEVQNLRIIRIIGDFQLHRTILRRYYKHKVILTDPYFSGINNRFYLHCVEKHYSAVTVDHYVKQSARFLDYVVPQRVKTCKEIILTLINDYIKTLAGYTSDLRTVISKTCALEVRITNKKWFKKSIDIP
ncbi:hypothetical protein [Oceanirhabdus seepicola]|uniref:Integrase SAM-like N-terminal domain-containing protein n=1 Tax=Oceanirhabdus seepicola TaxID=2828781 RepID=A0A9J6NYZ3_9CLOT|nr:hypothetical protein [Oceanirhabdus seepicola]MCM1989276.1 hypothetical protein [Oceanirhabdus seepicola]